MKTRSWILIAFAVVIAFLAGATALSYGVLVKQSESAPVRWLAWATHFPAARLGWRIVTYADYLEQLGAERIFLAGPAAQAEGLPKEPTAEMKQQVLDRTLRVAAVEDLAATNKFSVTQLEVERAYNDLVARAGTSTSPEEIKGFLRDQFGWNEQQFKQNVIRPALIEDGLKQKLGSTTDTSAFDNLMQARLDAPDVKKYLKF